MQPLEPARRRALRAKAHHLDPVVTIGHHGLTPAVLHEIDVALAAHELVKVRVMGDDRDAREDLLARICDELDCAPVQQIGKLLVLWRPRPAEAPRTPRGHAKPAADTAPRHPRKPAPTPVASPTRRHTAARPAGGSTTPSTRRATTPPVERTEDVRETFGAKSKASRAPRGVPRAALPRRRRGV